MYHVNISKQAGADVGQAQQAQICAEGCEEEYITHIF